ncbi:hypothetical protein AHF37_01679 [Paragonimus kellicotti]|nr:hypothetical protein AHF37_01679 [Paragonimus kellicotti]
MSQAISRSQLPSTSLVHRPTTPTLLATESNMSTNRVKVLHQSGFSTATQSDDSGLNGFRDQDSRLNTEDKDLEPTTVIAQASHILTKDNSSNDSDFRKGGNDILTTESTRVREKIWKPLQTQTLNSTDSSRTTSPDNLPDNSLHNSPKTSLMTRGSRESPHEYLVQLYILSDDPKRKDFLDELFAYMQRRVRLDISKTSIRKHAFANVRWSPSKKNRTADELPAKDLRQEFCKERKPEQIYLDKPEVNRNRPQLHHPHQQQQQKRKSSMPYLDQQAEQLHGAHQKDSRHNSSYLEKRMHLKNNNEDVKNRYFGSEASGLVNNAVSHLGYNLPPLGADTLATGTTTGVHPFFQNPLSKENTSNQSEVNNIYLHDQSPDEYRCSKSDFTEPNPQMSIGNCLPPMLAAAAMAALTGGRFSSAASTIAHLNPLLASASGNVFPAHMNSLDTTGEPMLDCRRTTADFANHQIGAYMEQSGGMSLISPMRAMYNTSKLLFGGGLDRVSTGTPPPPSLSASVSPQLPHREISKSTHTVFGALGDMEDEAEDEEPDDNGSIEPESNEPEGSGTNAAGQQWTFEEQFKQILSRISESNLRCLTFGVHAQYPRGRTPVNRIPIMAKQVLDLYELFQLVVARGGLVEVINKKLWREITKGLNLPSSITSAAFTLRTQYMKYLYPYECDTLGLSTPGELQAAIDGNRREARRSSYSFDYPMMVPSSGSVRPLSPPSLMGNLHASLSSLSGLSLPFGVNPGLDLNAQLSQLHPLLGFPSGSNTAAMSLVQPPNMTSTHMPPNSLFPPAFVHPIVSSTGFPLGAGGVMQSFTPNNLEESVISSSPSNVSTCLIPGIQNSFAAAAATLFGGPFPPSIPGAFATAIPQHSSSSSPSVSSSNPMLGANTTSQRPSPCGAHSGQSTESGSPNSLCARRNQTTDLPSELFTGKEKREKRLSDGRKEEKRNEQLNTRSKSQPIGQGNDNAVRSRTQSFTEDSGESPETVMDNAEASYGSTIRWTHPNPGLNTAQRSRLPYGTANGFPTMDYEELMNKTATQQPRQTSSGKLQPAKESDRCFSQTTSPLNLTANEQSPLEQSTKGQRYINPDVKLPSR